MKRILLILTAGILCAIAPTLSAQASLDLSVGYGRGVGGPASSDKDMLAMSSTISLALRQGSSSTAVVAIDASLDAGMGGTACLADPGITCAQFPSMFAVSALIGWTQHSDLASGARIMVGPALIYENSNKKPSGGLVARADWATPVAKHLSVVMGAQGSLGPKWYSSRIGVVSVTLGLRVH